MSGDFSAVGPSLGYYYQIRLSLLLLLKSDANAELSVEILDDIAIETGSITELIQTKHRAQNTTLTNASKDLWKTLRIWATEILSGADITKLKLTLVTTSKAPEGSAAYLLLNDVRDVNKALDILRGVASTSKSEENESAYKVFMSLNEKQQEELLDNIYIVDQSLRIEQIIPAIKRELEISTRGEHLEHVYDKIVGWWFDRVIKGLDEEAFSRISFQELRLAIRDIAEQFYKDNLPIDFYDLLPPDEAELAENEKNFIEQLKLVAVSNERIKQAISDYYRAFTQRSKWIREDLVLIDELQRYESRLIDEWKRLFLTMKEDLGDGCGETQIVRNGRALFNTIDGKNVNIRPLCTEPYVMRGSYHMLANKLQVGWHANFYDRLQHLILKAGEAVK